jgi:hypothetical protein
VKPVAPRGPEVAPRAPDDLAVLVRVSDPEQLVRDVVSILPPSAAAAAAALDPAQLLTTVLGDDIGAVLDVAQPIDMVRLGSSHPSFVVSVAVKPDSEPTLGKIFVLRDEGGLRRIQKRSGLFDPSAPNAPGAPGELDACAFTAAAGRATTRLVCASTDAALASAAAYLARNVAAEPLDVDARVTVPGRAVREKRDGTTKAMRDAAGARLGQDLVEKLVQEIERFDTDVRFAGPDVEIGLSLRLSGRGSPLARVLVPRSRPAPPPPAFYRLPADSLVALHATGSLPDDIAPLQNAIADGLEATLAQDGYRPEKTRALRERLASLLLTGGPFVLGAGVVGGRDGVDRALAAFEAARGNPAAAAARAETQARGALRPWVMIAIDEPAEKWTQGLRDIVRRAEDAERTRVPGSKASTPRDPEGDHVDLKLGSVDQALALPPGALHLEMLLTPRTKGKRPPRTAHVFVVAKGSATWFGYSEDAPAIASRLRIAMDDAIDVGTLARSSAATSLRAHAGVGAGLVSLGSVGHLTAATRTAEDLHALATTSSRMAGLRQHATESVTWSASADPASGSVGLSVQGRASRQTATELLHVLGL